MQMKNFPTRGHIVRGALASALVGTSLVVGLASAASAAGATHLALTPGYSTSVASGAAFATPLQISLLDGSNTVDTGNGSTITATVSGGAQIVNATAVASSGVATFTTLKLNALVGTYTVTFSDGALTPTTSSAITVTVGTATKLALTTSPSAGDVSGVALTHQPVVKVEDSGGNVVTSVTTGTSTATIATGPGSVVAGSTVSYVNGVATFANLTLAGTSGTTNTLSYSGPFASVVSGSVTMSGPATQLVIGTQPSATATSGAVLVQQPVIKVEDASNNVVVADSSTVIAVITNGGTPTLSNGAVNVVDGIATFSGLSLNAPAGTYSLIFANGTFATAASSAIVVAAGVPAKIVVTTEPSTFVASGVALSQQPVVKIEDALGDVVTTFATGSVTAAIATGAGGSITAGATAPFVAGVANFSGLTLTGTVGSTYTLLFTGASLSVVDTAHVLVGAAQATLSVNAASATWGRSLTLGATGGSGNGALSFTVTGGTATGCAISSTTLTYTSLGTCVVTASKAADTTFTASTSAPVTFTIVKLPIPGVVRVLFAKNSSSLTRAAKNSLLQLAIKLTPRSRLTVTGYAYHNKGLAQRRVTVVVQFLATQRLTNVGRHYSTSGHLQAVQVRTTGQ